MAGRLNRRRGFTLLELIVVLAILVALGSMIIAVIPGFVQRTHYAKCATTIPELNRIWMRSFVTSQRYPDRLDTLLNATGDALFSALPGNGSAGGELQLGTLASDEIAALNAIGLHYVYPLQLQADDVTYGASPRDSVATPLASTGTPLSAAILNLTGGSVKSLNLKRHLGRDGVPGGTGLDADSATVKYVVFGIGPNCTAVGPNRSMEEAPVHFGGEDAMNPQRYYQRYCVIFSVNGAEPAQFEAACSVHPRGLDGAEAHIRSYYEKSDRDGA